MIRRLIYITGSTTSGSSSASRPAIGAVDPTSWGSPLCERHRTLLYCKRARNCHLVNRSPIVTAPMVVREAAYRQLPAGGGYDPLKRETYCAW